VAPAKKYSDKERLVKQLKSDKNSREIKAANGDSGYNLLAIFLEMLSCDEHSGYVTIGKQIGLTLSKTLRGCRKLR